MLRLKAEPDGQGISCEAADIGMVAAMAQNSSLNYGGVTPAMPGFGNLPKGIMATAGALQADLTVFERAVCIRQMSLSAVQQATVDDRTAIAIRTGSNRLDTWCLEQQKFNSILKFKEMLDGAALHFF